MASSPFVKKVISFDMLMFHHGNLISQEDADRKMLPCLLIYLVEIDVSNLTQLGLLGISLYY